MNKKGSRAGRGVHRHMDAGRVYVCKPNQLSASIRAALQIYTPALVSYDGKHWHRV